MTPGRCASPKWPVWFRLLLTARNSHSIVALLFIDDNDLEIFRFA